MPLLKNIWLSSKIFLVFLHLKFLCGLAVPRLFMAASHILIGSPCGNFREVFPGYGNEWSKLHAYIHSSFCVEGTLIFKCLLRSLNKENLELLSDNIIESF